MKTRLTLEDVLSIITRGGLLDERQAAHVRQHADEQQRHLASVQELRDGGEEAFEITPAEIIASFKLTSCAADGEPLDEEAVVRSVAGALGIPFRKIDPLELDLDVVTRNISRAFAVRSRAVPVAVVDGRLQVAMVDPLDREVRDDIERAQTLPVEPVMSTKHDIINLIREFFGFKRSVVLAERELESPIADIGNFEQYARLGSVGEIESTDTYVKNAVDYLFRYAFEQRASDIHVEPKRERSVVRFRIDGVLHPTYTLPTVVHSAVISRLKTLARMDIAEKRRPQDGRIKLEDAERSREIRVSTVPVAFGEKAVLRVLSPDILFQELDALGFSAADLIRYRGFLRRPHGIILFTGPTGSGKTTSLYSSLRSLATPEKNITTIEDPIEMVCEDYNQIAVQPAAGVTFASALRTILRQDPDIIMVGEIRDQETARNAIQSALTGHLVLSTLHTNDAASAVTRLLDLGVEPFLISSTLVGVVAQRLLRTICPHCQEEVQLSREEFVGLGLKVEVDTDPVVLRQGRGCRLCRSTGFIGREAVTEVLEVSEVVRQLIVDRATADQIRQQAVREGMRMLWQNAVDKVLKGRSTYQEVLRCINLDD